MKKRRKVDRVNEFNKSEINDDKDDDSEDRSNSEEKNPREYNPDEDNDPRAENDDHNDKAWDRLFEQAVQENFKVDVPSHLGSWARVNAQIQKQRKGQAFRRRFQMIAALVTAAFIGAVLFGNPTASNAFMPLSKLVESVTGDVMSFFFGNDKDDDKNARTSRPKEVEDGEAKILSNPTQDRDVSPEEVKKLAKYPVYIPSYIPAGFVLIKSSMVVRNESVYKINFDYKDSSSNFYQIEQTPLTIKTVLSQPKEESNGTMIVEILGKKAYLSKLNDTRNSLIWGDNFSTLTITGSLSYEVLIDLASSLK